MLAEWGAKEEERQEAMKRVKSKGGDSGDDDAAEFVSYVPLPEQKEIELRVLQRKKQELMVRPSPPAPLAPPRPRHGARTQPCFPETFAGEVSVYCIPPAPLLHPCTVF